MNHVTRNPEQKLLKRKTPTIMNLTHTGTPQPLFWKGSPLGSAGGPEGGDGGTGLPPATSGSVGAGATPFFFDLNMVKASAPMAIPATMIGIVSCAMASSMDHLKGSIGLRGFAEQDPKVAYKREGGNLFDDMFAGIREKVTDMIFKVRLTADTQMQSVYQVSGQVHEQLQGYDYLARDMADQQAAARPEQKVAQITRDIPKVGRNDPCPCGSGKKYKKCCGRA